MATFSAQVVDLVGTFSDETALDSFVTEGANEVISAMPRSAMERVAEETTVTDGSTTSEGHKIIYVLRNDGTIDQPCRRVSAYKRGRVQDSSDMEFATTSDPVYYIQDGKINIFPNGNGLMVSIPTYSQSSPLDASGISTITNFPDEYEYLVVLYAAIKALQQNLSGLVEADFSISASAPSAPSLATLSGGSVSPITVASVSKADISGDVPAYTKPSSSVDFGTLSSSDTSAGTEANLGFDDFINSEDVEMASISLQKQQELLRAYQLDIQNELNEYNKENARYQANVQAELAKHNSDLQKALRQAQLDGSDAQQESAQTLQAAIQNNDDLVQKFLAELNKYTAQVNSEVQTYSQNVANNAQKFQHTVAQQSKLQADYDKGIQIMRAG
tara:strand:+ start:24 stop:1187 length:1164 start_codon:yes stop_codon:yes gene_type:complete